MVKLFQEPLVRIPEPLMEEDICVIESSRFLKENIGKEVVLHHYVPAGTVAILMDGDKMTRFSPKEDAWIVYCVAVGESLIAMFADNRSYRQKLSMVRVEDLKFLRKKPDPEIQGYLQSRIPMING